MEIKSIQVLDRTPEGFGLQSDVRVLPPFEWGQRERCRECPMYTHGCSGPLGEFNNRLTLNFSRYIDDALIAFDNALCGLGILWKSYIEKASVEE